MSKSTPKYADELKSMFKKLRKGTKPPPLEPLEPLPALVRAAMSYDVDDARAERAMELIDHEFVDLNELRVATDLEVQELLGAKYPEIEKRVGWITQALNYIFEHEHTMSLERLRTLNKRDARQFLKEIPEISPFVEAYIMLYAFGGNCIPLDQKMFDCLVAHGAIDPALSLEEAQRYIEYHVKAEDAYEFYRVVRAASARGEEGKGKKKRGKP